MRFTLQRLIFLAGLVATLPAAGADITFYEHDRFGGRSFTANQSIQNFANIGFNDLVSSVIVRSGSWQLCTDAYFRGRCVTVSPGEYPTMRNMDLNDRISSARELDWIGGGGGGGNVGGGGRPSVELFDGYEFAGRAFPVNDAINNFGDVGFNDRTQSIIVYRGTWEACEHAGFRGDCQVFGPGRYPNLGRFGGRISAMRPVEGGIGGGGGGWGTGARAILYEGSNLSGRSFVIDNEVASNLANTGFNDRAASLRVEAGYWIFCSDANFGGECRTFGPGDYPTLPWGLSYKISSGRRIHGQYPYSQNPSWPR
jgi:hypothetical protein